MSSSTTQTIDIPLKEAINTSYCASSLIKSLYTYPVTILLNGELGAGKTTFVKAMADALGIKEQVTSPTFALEQRYESPIADLLHTDLYRLDQKDADALIASSDDWHGIRCIEWASRLSSVPRNAIRLDLEESQDGGRVLHIAFADMPLPTLQQIEQWRQDVLLPDHIVAHCKTVAQVAQTLADALINNGIIVRREAVIRAAHAHDLFRFVDFRAGAGLPDEQHSHEQLSCWTSWKERYPQLHHEALCARFFSDQGFAAFARIIEPHGLMTPLPFLHTTEQKILFYADKRVKMDHIVTLQERFDDFRARYSEGKTTKESALWEEHCKEIESMLFPDGPPL